VRMWVLKNFDSVFYYVEHVPWNLNIPNQDDTPFTLEIQIVWQCEMMSKHGQGNAIAFDITWRAPKFIVRPKKSPTMLKSGSSWNLVPLLASSTKRG
jgi:hypothetical protein